MSPGASEPSPARTGARERFTVRIRIEPRQAVLQLAGELDHDTAPTLDRALGRSLQAASARILVECSQLRFCDSTGLNVLLRCRLSALEAGTTVELIGLAPQVARVFEITGATSVFPVHASLDDALAHGG